VLALHFFNDQFFKACHIYRMFAKSVRLIFTTVSFKLINEALRLYPPVPVNSRTATRTTTLPVGGGDDLQSPVLVSEGTVVGFHIYGMQRRPDLYGMDAEVFRPERWDEKMPLWDSQINAKWGYLPFNGGPRACLGSECFDINCVLITD
jgi:cytochrome P450